MELWLDCLRSGGERQGEGADGADGGKELNGKKRKKRKKSEKSASTVQYSTQSLSLSLRLCLRCTGREREVKVCKCKCKCKPRWWKARGGGSAVSVSDLWAFPSSPLGSVRQKHGARKNP